MEWFRRSFFIRAWNLNLFDGFTRLNPCSLLLDLAINPRLHVWLSVRCLLFFILIIIFWSQLSYITQLGPKWSQKDVVSTQIWLWVTFWLRIITISKEARSILLSIMFLISITSPCIRILLNFYIFCLVESILRTTHCRKLPIISSASLLFLKRVLIRRIIRRYSIWAPIPLMPAILKVLFGCCKYAAGCVLFLAWSRLPLG